MGTNKRYARYYDKQMDERILQRYITTAGPLQSLSDDELELDVVPVTIYPKPPLVKAWVRFGPQHARVEARLMRSTDSAAGIEFTVKEKTYRCWVWGNAVTAADPPSLT